jgi:hypothetical protein
MKDQGSVSGTRLARRRIIRGAMTVGVTTVMMVALNATAASARPAAVNPPAPSGTVTTDTSGHVTISVSGTWSWAVGTGNGQLNIPSGSPASQCAGNYGVGWGMAWSDAADPGYTLSHKGQHLKVGSTLNINTNVKDQKVHVGSPPCGDFNSGHTAVTGQWKDSHVYANANSVPATICVVTYLLRAASTVHPKQYKVNKNKKNSFKAAVKHSIAYTSPPNCFATTSLVASPIIVTTATNAQVGSPITDTATLSGTSQDVTTVSLPRAITVVGNAGGTVTFTLYGPTDTGCTSTPIFTSSPIAVNGNGIYGPVSFTPTEGPGVYRWIAQYSGDPGNNGAIEVCGAAGETSTVSTTAVASTTNPPTSPSSSVPVTTTSATDPATGSTTTSATAKAPTAVSGATTVHTGEPWAGSGPYLAALVAFGLSLVGLGYRQRRRTALRRDAAAGISAD